MSHVRIALMLLLTITGVARAQPGASHGVAIGVPSFTGIRIVGSGSGRQSVVFDFQTEPAPYLSALLDGEPLSPTNVDRFDDVQLNITANGRWNVWVNATPLTTPAGPGPHGLTLASISVVAGAVSGLHPEAVVGPSAASTFFAGTWTLAADPAQIARGIGSTSGWRSLGFNGHDYLLDVDGNEKPGTYTTIVMYSLAAP